MTVIRCEDLEKIYGKQAANHQLSFSIKENTITGVIGRNGAGKTTLLKMLAGFIQPTSGSLQVFKEEPFQNLKVAANMIFIDDQMAFPASYRLPVILESCAHFYPNWDSKLAHKLLDYFELPQNKVQNQLSKGQKSTLHMIIGLAARCPLTIYDEPTTGMDSSVRKDFYRALLKDYVQYPRTILLSSHQVEEIEHLLEEVLVIDRGESILHIDIDQLREYAVALTGDAVTVSNLTKENELIYQESIGNNQLKVIVKNDGSIRPNHPAVTMTSVAPHDLVVYLTKGEKGGIDRVFQ